MAEGTEIEPDEFASLDRLTIKSAFQKFVMESPDVKEAIERLASINPSAQREFEEFGRTAFQGRWPLHIKIESTIEGSLRGRRQQEVVYPSWIDQPGRSRPPLRAPEARDAISGGSTELRQTYRRILCRYQALIDALCSGRLKAHGRSSGSGNEVEIPPTYWDSGKSRLEIDESTLVIREGRVWKAKFDAVTLGAASDRSRSAVSLPDPERLKGGRPPKYAWEEAFDQLTIELGTKGLPETGQAMADMLLGCFQKIGGEVPNHQQASDWLRKKFPRLWRHVTRKAEN